MDDGQVEIAAALRRIARGFDALADAVAGSGDDTLERQMSVIREWGERGLDRDEVRALFREHGFAPQTSGGWARGDWIETRADGLRYLTARSLRLLEDEGYGV